MGAHKVVTFERGGGYAARCEDCDEITFGGFASRSEAREALARHEDAPGAVAAASEGAIGTCEREQIMLEPTQPQKPAHGPLPEALTSIGAVDFRAEVIEKVTLEGVDDGTGYYKLGRGPVAVTADLGEEWEVTLDLPAYTSAARAQHLAEEIRWGAMAAEVLNAQCAILVPETWTGHATLRTQGAALLVEDGTLRAVNRAAVWRPECVGVFREVGRISRGGRVHTVLVGAAS